VLESRRVAILENAEEWLDTYRQGWLAHLQATGEADYKGRYVRPKNSTVPAGRGVNLAQSRLVLITSAGAYLRDHQPPFDADNLLGDYTLRLFPSSTRLDALAYAHDHYDHSAVNSDPQVLVPLRHLENLVVDGVIGELAPCVISFSGYQPDATRTVSEVIPAVIEAARAAEIDAALLVPA